MSPTLRLLLTSILSATPTLTASVPPLNIWSSYESGALGPYPLADYHTITASTPLIHIAQWHPSCDNSSYVFLSPHAVRLADNMVLMLDARGNVVWYHQERGAVHNIQVQRFKGSEYITYWVGDDEFYGHGAGFYKMVR